VETTKKKQFIDEFKGQWRCMWRDRLEDKVRAEGIANEDYALLFVNRGTVISATRKFKLLDFYELLRQHKSLEGANTIPSSPSIGGWGKFTRTALNTRNHKRGKQEAPLKSDRNLSQQLKKGGRGWLHFKK